MKTDYDVAQAVLNQWEAQAKEQNNTWLKVAVESVKQKLYDLLKR